MGGIWRTEQLVVVIVGAILCSKATSDTADHVFTIRHEQSNKCLQYHNNQTGIGTCSETNSTLLWKWVSNHRLFHLDTRLCLGVDLYNIQDPLKMVPCNSSLMLWWRCPEGHITGASNYRLSVKGEAVTLNFLSNDTWRRDSTSESICDLPYHVLYTRGGNSHGAACEFPFLRKETWHHGCIREKNDTGDWCATTSNFDTDGKWGYCLKPGNCYQFNMESALTWKEAYTSCRNQGADLLSISSTEELNNIKGYDNLPNLVWIGLNRLDTSGGWQWSDNSPLSFINWNQEISRFSVMDGLSCGALNTDSGQWQNSNCESSFPYICKKKLTNEQTKKEDFWFYTETECEENWIPYNGFCYKLQKKSRWEDANNTCNDEEANLISMHSLADIEMVVTKFQAENEDIWSGFKNEDSPTLFKWSDGTETHFTYWDQIEPNTNINNITNCVSFSGKTGRWHVRSCNESFKFICKKNGTLKNDSMNAAACPQEKGWRRHGHFCYLVDKEEVLSGAKCNLNVTSKFEQEFLNNLIREHGNIEGKYFWTDLRDVNYTGYYQWGTKVGNVDLTYSNWNTHQPASPGGCVAMATGQSLGKWEVKDCKTFKAQSICKKRIGSSEKEEIPANVPSPNPHAVCPDGWHTTHLYCYKLFHHPRILRKRTWEEAEGLCEELGGHILSFTHSDEVEEIKIYINSVVSESRWFWTGLNKRNPTSQGTWEWSDERPEDYDLRDCAAFKVTQDNHLPWGFLWGFLAGMDLYKKAEFYLKPFHCDVALEWVCQIPKGGFKSPEWYTPDLNNSSVIIDGDKFWFVQKSLSYSEAALYCTNNDSELASILSPLAHKAILQLINGQGQVQPQNENLHTDYDYIDCNQRLPFLCQKQNISLLENDTQTTGQLDKECPKNWTAFGNKCYLKIEKHKYLSFSKAKEECESLGGTLPIITSQLQQDFITSLLPDIGTSFWIGLISVNQENPKWVNGHSPSFENFIPYIKGRIRIGPSNPSLQHQCFYIQYYPTLLYPGIWNVTYCTDQQYVALCQKDKGADGNQTKEILSEDADYKGHKYKIIQKNMTWYSALSECNKHNMQLVSITDPYQLAYLTVQVGFLERPMWIGLTSSNDGIHYRWQDGKRVVLSRWSDEEEAGEQCVYINTDGFWKTTSCDVELPGGFCHFKTEDPQKTTTENTLDCPHRIKETPWVPFRNSCYIFLLKHDRWLYSENVDLRFECKSLHPDSYVLSIRDEEESGFVLNQLEVYRDLVKWTWLGIFYDENERRFRWYDKTYVKYSNWRFGRIKVDKDIYLGVMDINGYWDLVQRSRYTTGFQHKTAVVCKIEKGAKEHFNKSLPEKIPFGNITYHVIQKKVTWHEAIKECRKGGGHLASIHSMAQQVTLENIIIDDGFELWIGLSSQEVNPSRFEWSDGSNYDYFPLEFEKLHDIGYCGFLDKKGAWGCKNCMEVLSGAVCYNSISATVVSVTSDPLCPVSLQSGVWVRQKNFCYGFDESLYNYTLYNGERTKGTCSDLDPTSVPLTITDAEENEFVRNYLQSNPFVTNRIWLGLDPTTSDTGLKWLDGSPVKYTNWTQEGPKGQCAVFSTGSGTWQKVSCTSGHARLVCKAPLKSSGNGAAIGFAVFIIILLLVGLIGYFYKTRRSLFSSTIRYRRTEDEMETMFVNMN
ncbi:hypothetical protein GDO86_016860 [Hymenochirus boettgeri]|uniref:Lymphocyte antigen 75 n=1 Tax=Hymenochirus boettgeri TaxID=247094 RepID=A0A8T2IMS8_9PIPI|nr:hypothetical protein GDO86_016860 [Hymenochirus boettgeri]